MNQFVHRCTAHKLLTKYKLIREIVNVTDIVCIMMTTTQHVTLHKSDMEIKGYYEDSDKW